MGTEVSETGSEIKAERTRAGRNSTLLMAALAGTAAFAVLVPFFFLGNASGHDFEFHLASWLDVAGQWRAGVLYPRWAALANWGFGEPRFIFYPPASWMLGAALSFVLPWAMVPGAFIWLALTIAGVTMFRLAREWLPTRDAMAAGVLFALNPYHLVMVYWRSDFAELLTSSLIPLAVLFAMRTATEPRRAFVPLALVTAGAWLCNAPAAVVVTYMIALILVIVAAHERSAKPLICGGGALALGLALAAFYIVPAALEQPWVNIAETLSQGLKFPENFLFTRTADAEHTRFNFIVSWVAVEVIAVTFLAIFAAGRWRRGQPRLWWVVAALVAVSTILMLPVTSPLWAPARASLCAVSLALPAGARCALCPLPGGCPGTPARHAATCGLGSGAGRACGYRLSADAQQLVGFRRRGRLLRRALQQGRWILWRRRVRTARVGSLRPRSARAAGRLATRERHRRRDRHAPTGPRVETNAERVCHQLARADDRRSAFAELSGMARGSEWQAGACPFQRAHWPDAGPTARRNQPGAGCVRRHA